MASRQDVVDFLALFKGAMMLGNWTVKDRLKNRQSLIDLAITPDERAEILKGLEPEDYMAGPKPDDTDPSREVWEFGKNVNGREVYIKLRVTHDPRSRSAHRALVWSFQLAEFPTRYPLKGGAV